MAAKTLLRRVLLGANPIPQYAVIGVPEAKREVRVELRGDGTAMDVTDNNVIASLRPLRIAIALPPERAVAAQESRDQTLVFGAERSGRELGLIRLRLEAVKPLADDMLCLFRSQGCVNRCVSRWKSVLYDHYRAWSARRRGSRYNHQMSRKDLQSFFVFYTYPRPVALVTVQADDGGNIFPMDLMGPTRPPYFLLALHSTAPSIPRIKQIGRITLSYVPVDLADVVYELGKNHRVARIDWNTVPFPLRTSPLHGWPVPDAVLAILELAVEDAWDLGSHHLFVTRIVQHERRADGARMCHIQGFFQDYLRRHGRELAISL